VAVCLHQDVCLSYALMQCSHDYFSLCFPLLFIIQNLVTAVYRMFQAESVILCDNVSWVKLTVM
jgi:hypothetical protein